MDILYYDANLVACIKPVGMDSEHGVPQVLSEALGGPVLPVHRLDKNVGGVMVYARSKAAASALSQAVQSGQMVKEYVALVHGNIPQCGDWEDLLFKDSRKNKVFVVKRERKGVKKARLTFTRLTAGETSLVRVRLYTGRSHQIRVQFSSRGYPLVGDHKYGARDSFDAPMLYSCCITFPFGGKELRYTSLPDWAQEV